MAKANFVLFRKKFADFVAGTPYVEKITKKKTDQIGRDAARFAKEHLKYQVISHPISQEIAAGPNATTTFSALQGWGNLYGFLGFEQGQDPIGDILDEIESSVGYTVKRVGKGKYVAEVYAPSEDQFDGVAELPWLGGSNWVKLIARGAIPGLPNFLPNDGGRSGGGIQANGRVRTGGNKVQRAYYKPMFDSTIKEVRRKMKADVRAI